MHLEQHAIVGGIDVTAALDVRVRRLGHRRRITVEAAQRQLDFYAATPGADKVVLASEMAEQAKQIALEGVRCRNADLSEAQVHATWLRMLHGKLAVHLASASTAETP